MSGATDLIGLIDLSLGEKPSGVVNFNYLHSLLHEIVRRLGIYEEQQMSIAGPMSGIIQNIDSSGRIIRGSTVTIPEHGPLSDTSLAVGITGQGMDSADGTPMHSSSVSTAVIASRSGQQPHLSTTSITGSTPAHASSQPIATTTGAIPPGADTTQLSSSIPTMGQSSSLPMAAATSAGSNQSVAMTTGQQSSPTINGGVTSTGQPISTHSDSAQMKQPNAGGSGGPTVGGGSTNVGGPGVSGPSVSGANVGSAGVGVPSVGGPSVGGVNVREGEDRVAGDRSGHTSSSDITGRLPSASNKLRRHRSGVTSAANDLGFLERKLSELESRVNTMESLPELMERKGSDVNATPIRDMWNFTNLNGKVKSVEDGIDKTSQLVDDLLGEVQALKQQLGEVQGSVGKRLDSLDNKVAQSSNEASKLEEELKQLKAFKMAASSDSPSEAFMGIVNELQGKVDGLQTESNVSKEKLKQLQGELGKAVSSEDFSSLQDSVKEFSGTTDSRLTVLQGKIDASDFTMEGNMKTLSASMENLSDQMKTLETALSDKVSASDLTSLMPTGTNDGDSTAALLSELLKLQNKVHALEDNASKQPSVPSDLMDKVNSMQNAIDHLSTELSKLAKMDMGGADSSRLDDLGSQIAQLRERMEESDIAIGALTNALSEQGMAVRDDKTGEYVDMDSFKGLQELVQNLQESQERLLGTLANISHELEVNQEHVKALYSTVDDLRATKVDKSQLAIEVDEKADRSALEGKASREWVDSTFERLDREIREAKSHLLGQEEAFRSAVGQLNEDVEGKLDRMELEPFKEYIDEKFQRIKTAPVNVDRHEHVGEDAAGFRKPMRFRCISCDKPLGLKSTDPIPTLPMSDTLPPTKSFRPYTTYELELIRRHQRIQPAVLGPPPSFPVSIRSAGGSHTLTRPHQKIRVTPYSSGTIPENTTTTTKSMPSVFVHDEMDIVGQDGHIYKGRMMKQTLPPVSLRKYPRNRATKIVRPSSTTPLQTIPS